MPNREPKGLQLAIKKVLEETKFGRDFVFKKARESVMSKTGGVYPAPLKVCTWTSRLCSHFTLLKIIDVLKHSASVGFGSHEGYAKEAAVRFDHCTFRQSPLFMAASGVCQAGLHARVQGPRLYLLRSNSLCKTASARFSLQIACQECKKNPFG